MTSRKPADQGNGGCLTVFADGGFAGVIEGKHGSVFAVPAEVSPR